MDFGGNESLAILSAKDQVKDKIASGIGQGSFAPSELAACLACLPTACAVGCIIAPLRGWAEAQVTPWKKYATSEW